MQNIIENAVQAKIWYFLRYGFTKHCIYDYLVFNQIRKVMGGRIRFILSGGAPLSSEVRNFMTVVFSTPVFEAYGLTETSGILTCTAQWDV